MDGARLFVCVRCQRQVQICSHCDRGQQYCGAQCAGMARGESLRAAGRRYQQTRRGRHCHAERQRRYRTRLRADLREEKVTHHGSALTECSGLLVPARIVMRETTMVMSGEPKARRCHFCARPVSDFVRLGWLRAPLHRGPRTSTWR